MIEQGYGFLTFTTKKSEKPQVQQPQIMFQQPPIMIQQPQLQIQPQMQIQPLQIQQPQIMMQPQIQQQIFPQIDNLYPQTNSSLTSPPSYPMQIKSEQLKNDEEFARSLDKELNGNGNNINNNNINNIQVQQQPQNIIPQFYMIPNQRPVNNHHSADDLIFVGLNSFVSALNKFNGQIIWRTNISSMSGIPLSVIYTNGKILVGAVGKVVCLDALTGQELWTNKLPGLRYSNVSIISTTNNNINSQSSPMFYVN